MAGSGSSLFDESAAQHTPRGLQELIWRERLAQEVLIGAQVTAIDELVPGVARDKQHPQGGASEARLTGELDAVHVRHHHVGDQQIGAVRVVSERGERVRGGDEFVVLLAQIDQAADAAVVARKILAALMRPFVIGPHRIAISTSIGIAVYPEHGDEVSGLLKNADTAMYHAKKAGRGCYRFFRELAETTRA